MSAVNRGRVELSGWVTSSWATCRDEDCRDWRRWLQRQSARPDRVGAFARLAERDPGFPKLPWRVLRYLQERRACPATFLAGAQAVREHMACMDRALVDDLERARDLALSAVEAACEWLAETGP